MFVPNEPAGFLSLKLDHQADTVGVSDSLACAMTPIGLIQQGEKQIENAASILLHTNLRIVVKHVFLQPRAQLLVTLFISLMTHVVSHVTRIASHFGKFFVLSKSFGQKKTKKKKSCMSFTLIRPSGGQYPFSSLFLPSSGSLPVPRLASPSFLRLATHLKAGGSINSLSIKPFSRTVTPTGMYILNLIVQS